MKTTHLNDYFAPLGSHTRVIDPRTLQGFMPIVPLLFSASPQLTRPRMVPFDCADCFTYIIMGLAAFLAILIPALNWN